MNSKKSHKLIKGKRIFLRYPQISDTEEFINLSKKSKSFHAGLVNPPKDFESFEKYIERNDSVENELFLICLKEDGKIIGMINLSQIFLGNFKNAYLGYYLFADFTGKGFMSEALDLILKFAFCDLGLHRLEANIQPHNLSSIKLVEKFGFIKEGFSPKYLKINGKWCDHERWAIIKENWKLKSNCLEKKV